MPTPHPDGLPPTKPFYLPQTLVGKALALPAQILFAVLGMLGLATWARQIVRVVPRQAAKIVIGGDGEGAGREVNLASWIDQNVPSLKGTFKPSWWLPK